MQAGALYPAMDKFLLFDTREEILSLYFFEYVWFGFQGQFYTRTK